MFSTLQVLKNNRVLPYKLYEFWLLFLHSLIYTHTQSWHSSLTLSVTFSPISVFIFS